MSATEEAVILSAARTPIGKFMGALMPSSATDLGAVAFRAVIVPPMLPAHSVDPRLM